MSTAQTGVSNHTESIERLAGLHDRAGFLLDELDRLQPAQNEVAASAYRELKIVYENKDFAVSASSASELFGIRSILEGGQPGFLTTNLTGDQALRDAALEVQTIARLSPGGPFFRIADPAVGLPALDSRATGAPALDDLAGGPAFIRIDPRVADMTPATAIQFAELLIAEARLDSRIAIDRAEVSVNLGYSILRNSKGIVNGRAGASFSFYIMGMAREGEQVTSFDYDGETVFAFEEIEENIRTAVGRFRDSVLRALNPEKGASYKGAVLLHPRTAMSLIGGVASVNCNARLHQDGISPWRERVGESVARSELSVFEEPSNADRPRGFRPFDREGVATRRHELIAGGKLNHIAHNCYTAARESEASDSPFISTGNATGGTGSQPAVGFSNPGIAIVAADSTGSDVRVLSEDELFRAAGDVLLLQRFSGNTDHTSGNFSGVAKNSCLLRAGERGPAVKEMMVQGDSFALLQSIVAAGETTHELMSGGTAPYVLVDGLSVTAG